MKKFTFIALLAALLCGCAQFADEELSTQKVTAPESIEASFEEPASRTYVENDKYLRWTAGDEISYFPGVTFNMEYRFTGVTGANNGSFSKVTVGPVTGNELSRNYAIYPYDEDIAVSDEGVISLNLPAVQKYAENSFGVGANTMVAATNGTNDEVLKFRNVGGYLKIKLYGDDVTVKSVKLQGNNNEKIAGPALITATYGNDPTVVMTAEATTSVTIDCEEGVTISDNSETPTEFWFVLPTVTFEDGFTITVTDVNDGTFVKSTSNTFTIDRNMIQPMQKLKTVITPLKPSYKVGDFVNYNGGDGIVYYADNTTVKLVSVTKTSAKWGLSGTNLQANNENNGLINATTVMNQGKIESSPALLWCDTYGDGWYLPARMELREIFNVQSEINNALTANDYDTISGTYWSSTESGAYCAYLVTPVESYLGDKTSSYNVRAVISFDI